MVGLGQVGLDQANEARERLEEGRQEQHMNDTASVIDPEHAALLVMDYQPGILRNLANADDLLAAASNAISAFRTRGGTVGYVRVAFDDADYDALPPTSPMAIRIASVGKAFHSDSADTAIHDRIAPAPGDVVVRKTRVGAFSTTDLDKQLHQREITTLVLAGVSTSGVVLSTVRDAHDRDYQIFVLSDACADPDPEVHAFLNEKIFPRQANVITTDQLNDLLAAPQQS